jgi:hypothetical protein
VKWNCWFVEELALGGSLRNGEITRDFAANINLLKSPKTFKILKNLLKSLENF